MDERFVQQLFAELIQSAEDGVGLVVAALAEQIDADRLTDSLRRRIAAAKGLKSMPPIALRIATAAMAAAEAESALKRQAKH